MYQDENFSRIITCIYLKTTHIINHIQNCIPKFLVNASNSLHNNNCDHYLKINKQCVVIITHIISLLSYTILRKQHLFVSYTLLHLLNNRINTKNYC